MHPRCQSDLEPLDPVVIEALRRQTPAQRLDILDGMWRSASHLVKAGVRSQYPTWNDEQVCREVARRIAGSGESL